MNRAIFADDDARIPECQTEFRRTTPPNQRVLQADYARRKRPTGYNGIHRRRNKRWTW